MSHIELRNQGGDDMGPPTTPETGKAQRINDKNRLCETSTEEGIVERRKSLFFLCSHETVVAIPSWRYQTGKHEEVLFMAKYNGYLNIGIRFGVNIGAFIIDDKINYANQSAMIIDTMMRAGISLFQQADVCRRCGNKLDAETSKKKACAIMNTLCAWKEIPTKRPADCPTSWLDDAWATLHTRYEEYVA